MEYSVQVIIERAVRFRKKLTELENKRAQYDSDVPDELWNDLVLFSRKLDWEERKAEAACRIKAKKVNDTRKDIIETLEKYNHWREQMRQVEDLFLMHVVRPGYRLRQAVLQREYLEGEFRRLRRNIDNEHYDSLEELTSDIQQVLSYGDSAFEAQDEDIDEEEERESSIFDMMEAFDVDQLVDEIEREAVVREYKRVVLPGIHPDTSNSSGETFKTVYEAYEKRDFLLMQAYIVQYRGEIVPDPNEDPILLLDQVDQNQNDYSKLKGQLDRRMEKMWKEITPQEQEDPVQVKENMRSQQIEINDRIREEAERILQLRQQIEDLAKYYIDHQG